MLRDDIFVILQFLKEAEKLKNTLRSAHTSTGRKESTAEHSWLLCLMAILLEQEVENINLLKLLKLCVIHDLGEAISGDIPAIEQKNSIEKLEMERNDYLFLISPLPKHIRQELLDLWEEYNSAESPEARFAKALDKIETIIQHNQGLNSSDFDYEFNLDYGREYTNQNDITSELRSIVDNETKLNIKNK